MKKLYALFLLIAGTFSALIFVPRILELSKPLDYLFTAFGILSAVALFLVVLKSSSKNKEEKNSLVKTKNRVLTLLIIFLTIFIFANAIMAYLHPTSLLYLGWILVSICFITFYSLIMRENNRKIKNEL